MELSEKLQQLRKERGLTQEELAQALYVSRTAVSKWESGRGYPNIDSLKAIAKYFSVTVDELLGGEAPAIAEKQQEEGAPRDVLFGLLDAAVILLWVLPLLGEKADGGVRAASLLSFSAAPYLRAAYAAFVIAAAALGLMTLALRNCRCAAWLKGKRAASLVLNAAGVLLFIAGRQPYAAAALLVFLAVKVFLLAKKP